MKDKYANEAAQAISNIPLFRALPQNLWVDSDWFSVAFQGWHNLEVFAHAESRARNFFRHPRLRPMIFCI